MALRRHLPVAVMLSFCATCGVTLMARSAAKIATAWRGCNNARCYKTRLWNMRVTAGNADGARVSALCNKNRPLGNGGTVTAAPGRPRESCRRGATITENEPHPRPQHDCARGARGPASTETSTKPAAEAPRNERANHFFSLLCGRGR